jgi:hypothetical protein
MAVWQQPIPEQEPLVRVVAVLPPRNTATHPLMYLFFFIKRNIFQYSRISIGLCM